jgi:Arc/MetJ family transcription regulator
MCNRYTLEGGMPTNLAIDDRLLQEALQIGGCRSKKEAVTKALEEFIERRQQRRVLKALGTFKFRKDWNYKQERTDR